MTINNIDQTKLIYTPPMQLTFVDPNTGNPADGKLFFKIAGSDTPKNAYIYTGDPQNPLVAVTELELNGAGSPDEQVYLFLLDEDDHAINQKYKIEVTNSLGTVIIVKNDFPFLAGNEISDEQTLIKTNIVTNGKFSFISDYKLKTSDTFVSQANTIVAPGWTFYQDSTTTTKNNIIFNNVATEVIEGNPFLELQFISSNVSENETIKEFRSRLGFCNSFEEKTLSGSLFAKANGNPQTVDLLLLKTYGSSQSPDEEILISTLNLTTSRVKYNFQVILPGNTGKVISENSNSLDFIIRPALKLSSNISFTSIFIEEGDNKNPIITDDIFGNIKAVSNQIDNDLIRDVSVNYAPQVSLNSSQQSYPFTGLIDLWPIGQNPPDTLECNGAVLKVSENKIPFIRNKRLYDKIGKTYGGAGDLIVTSNDNIVYFTSDIAAPPLTAYEIGTLNTKISITVVEEALKYGVKGTIQTASETAPVGLSLEFTPPFIPVTDASSGTYIGYSNDSPYQSQLSCQNTSTNPAICEVIFKSNDIAAYQTEVYLSGSIDRVKGALGFNSTSSNLSFDIKNNPNTPNTAPSISININANGQRGYTVTAINHELVVDFNTNFSVRNNVVALVDLLNTKFMITIGFNAIPAASEYFLFSSEVTNYYSWYKVDGVGSNPNVPNRTAIQVDINSTDTTDQVASKTSAALNLLEFNLPSSSNLPTIPDSLTKHYIHL